MPKICWRAAFACLWLWAGGVALCASSKPRFAIDTWDTEKGLPEMSVFALTQTHDGYLWVGAGEGLARFDGVHFKRYEANDEIGLSGRKFPRLYEDHLQNLWLGTETADVFRLSPNGKVTNIMRDKPPGEKLANIYEDKAGGVWLRMASGQLYWYAEEKLHPVANNCTGLLVEDSGLVWLGTIDGRLLALGPVTNLLPAAVFPISYEVPVGELDFLAPSKRGGFWCLANHRIQKWKQGHLEDLGPYPWGNVRVLAAVEDQDGRLVVGTFGDFVWWQNADGSFTRVDALDGLPHSSIWSLLVDHEGSLWVGSNGGGLSRVKPESFDVLDGTQGLVVQSLCEDRQGGLWIGYAGERIDHWSGGTLQRFTNLPLQSDAGFYTRAVFEDSAGEVWAGGGSVPRISPGGRVAASSPLLRFKDGRFTRAHELINELSVIYQDRQGTLWLGTQGGLARRNKDHWESLQLTNWVRAIAEDNNGNLWVGGNRGGISLVKDGKISGQYRRDSEGLPSDNISALYCDKQGVMWVGTSRGLARFENGAWTHCTAAEGLPRNDIGSLLEDDAGYLWLGTPGGLARISKRVLNDFAHHLVTSVDCRVFGKSDGLPSSECTSGSQPGPCRMRNGTLYFPTIQGVARLDLARLRPNTNPPPIAIETVLIDDQQLNADAPMRAPPPRDITVPAGAESIEITFASLNLSAAEKGSFRYKMTPYQNNWTRRPGNIRSARYINLPHGHWTFLVQACNEDGVWNETGATLAVTVLPQFWQTWWFLTGAGLCLLGAIIGSVHYVSTQKLQRQLAAMRQHEALERERARIARDLHDQLGANLTQVALLGELAESDKDQPAEVESHARQIAQTARDTTRSLDEIVWTVNPSNDTLNGLINYVCKYAQEYLAVAELKYRLEVPPQLPAVPISPELRHNLFLAAKEAINNVVKHSHANSAWVRLQLEPREFTLEIEDNGTGLPAGAENKGRNGLRNMRKRMEDVGGKFEVSPGAQGGTRVRLTAPLGNSQSAGAS